MSTISFSLADLFEQQFGYQSKSFSFPQLPLNSRVSRSGTDLYNNDAFGREFFMPVWIGQTTDNLIELQYPVIRIECKKAIVSTPMIERTGTVKELINTEDYKIMIKGLIIGSNGQWPEDQIAQLKALFMVQDSLIIKSALTDLFLVTPERGGSDKVVITDLKLPEGRGALNVRGYEMELISDEGFNLIEI